MLFRLHQNTGFPVVTLRPPFIYGPENPFYREAFFWDRLRDNRPIILPGDGHRLMQFVYIKDLVRACLRAMEEPAAVGEAFNVANEKPITQAEFVQAMAAAAGKKANIIRVPRDRIAEAGGDPMGQPAYFGVYLDVPPITEVVVKAKRILGFQPTPFEAGLKETYRWYLRNAKKTEDRLQLRRPPDRDGLRRARGGLIHSGFSAASIQDRHLLREGRRGKDYAQPGYGAALRR